MTPYTPPKKENETSLFKKELKFMDFHHVTFRYLNTTPLKGEEKTSLAVRIHDYVFPMQEALSNYHFKKTKQHPDTYLKIESGLKEAVRRAKISLAVKENNNELFIGYWKYLADVYREDATLLRDETLNDCINNFEAYVQTMKP
ncbi:MAG: hypothetical protein IT234_01765 [Bacteroidia bacterium]|nr:hypothetical protein [Bacteroidia bacterium]